MEYIKQKLIKKHWYYYFNYTLSEIPGKKRFHLSKYIGLQLPPNIKDLLLDFFEKDVAKKAIENTSEDIKNYFYPGSLETIEKNRFWYSCLLHTLFQKDFRLFRNLFYILFVLNSNRAEGSRVTRPDIEKIINKNIIKPKNDLDKEIINSIDAINYAFSKEFKWSTRSIKLIHKKLFYNLDLEMAGKYKKELNIAGDGVRGEDVSTTPPKEVPKDMRNLINWFKNKLKTKEYPPILALEFHWRFERIHPFKDGNGRVGRILLNALLVKNGFAPVIFFSQNHRAYCSAIAKARAGYSKKLAKHFVEHLKKTRKNIEQYKKDGVISGGSKQVKRWEINRGNIKIY